ncbi:MAG: hypothetical protein ACC628_07020 [Pirellulaceae bacterium]
MTGRTRFGSLRGWEDRNERREKRGPPIFWLIYQRLDLGEFASVQGKIETYVAERKSYQPT